MVERDALEREGRARGAGSPSSARHAIGTGDGGGRAGLVAQVRDDTDRPGAGQRVADRGDLAARSMSRSPYR